MAQYNYVLKGEPVPWARAGLCKGKFYDKQKMEKIVYGIDLQRQHEDRQLLTCPLAMTVTYHFRIPNSHHKKRDRLMGSPMSFSGDLDNYVKFTCDLCKDIIIHDDRIIWSIAAKKVWWDESKTEFSFITLGNE